VVPALRRARDRVAEFLAGIIFDGKHAVDVATESQRPDHVVRRSDQVVPAQRLEPLVLLARHPGSLVQIRREPRAVELADDLGAAELFLVRVDLVTPRQPEHPVGQLRLAYLPAITHDLAEEAVERVPARDVSDIFPVHFRAFPRPAAERRLHQARRTEPRVRGVPVTWHSPRLYLSRSPFV